MSNLPMLKGSVSKSVFGFLGHRTRRLLQHWSCAPNSMHVYHQRLLVQNSVKTLPALSFKRNLTSTCSRVWDSWKAGGINWVIRDLQPEDDEEALNILMENMCKDETLCALNNIANDPVSMNSIKDFWRGYLAHRISLGCYEEKDGKSKLVALNVFVIINKGEVRHDKIEGKAWQNIFGALKVCDDKLDPFELLGVDKVLYGLGLVVCKDYRGARLGCRILAAREHLALHLGIKGTSAVFTGPASQISAEVTGFSTALAVTLKDLAETGLDYPNDENRSIKLMVKKYGSK